MSQRLSALIPASGMLTSATTDMMKSDMTTRDHLRWRAAGRALVKSRPAASAATVRMAAARSSGGKGVLGLGLALEFNGTQVDGHQVWGNGARSGGQVGFHDGGHRPSGGSSRVQTRRRERPRLRG